MILSEKSATFRDHALTIRRNVAGHFEREVERRQILAWMILRIGELRDAEVVGPRLGAFVDAWIEIDEMPAGLAGRLDPIGADLLGAAAHIHPEAMGAAEIVRHLEAEFGMAGTVRLG